MEPWQERSAMLFGEEGLERLSGARVAVVGLGGVGAMAAEMLVRAGVGHIVLIDSDTVAESNLNRQLPALRSTIGLSKCSVMRRRLLDINPGLDVLCIEQYLNEESIPAIMDQAAPECVVDAIDTLSPKIALIQFCLAKGIFLVYHTIIIIVFVGYKYSVSIRSLNYSVFFII